MQEDQDLVNEDVSTGRGDIRCPQRRAAVRASQTVEVGEVGDEELPPAEKLADQVAAAHLSCGGQPTIRALVQRLDDRHAGRGDKRADVMFEGIGRGRGCRT